MENTIKKLIKKYQINSCSITIVKNYKVSLSKGFGKNIDIDTKFQACSVSKPIFALGVMLLDDTKQINIDIDVNQYLKSWQVPINHQFVPKITLRQLLSHTAGTTIHGFSGYNRKDKIPSIPQILNGEEPANSEKIIVDTVPGTIFRYSGGGTTIAQLAICDKLKKDFPSIMNNLLFKKMDLNCSYQQPIGKNKLSNYASGYTNKGKVKGDYHIYPEMAAAGLWTNSLDLAKIGIEICKGFHNKSDIFNKKIIKQMLAPIYKNAHGNKDIGIGFFLDNDIFYHTGNNMGYQSRFYFNRNGDGFVIMINRNQDENGYNFLVDITNVLCDRFEWDSAIKEKNVGKYYDKINNIKKKPIIKLEKYVGKYYDKINNIKCDIKIKSNKITMNLNKYDFSINYREDGYFTVPGIGIIEFRNNKLYLYQKTIRNMFLKK